MSNIRTVPCVGLVQYAGKCPYPILPSKGMITISELAAFLKMGQKTLIKSLNKYGIAIETTSDDKASWRVELGDLAKAATVIE